MSIDQIPDLTVSQKRELLRRLILRRDGRLGDVVPLSHGQRSLWFVHQLAPQNPAYNFLYAGRVATEIDKAALQRACLALADRHPMLRTTFESVGRRPVHRVHPQIDLIVNQTDASAWSREELLAAIRADGARPFDLWNESALRIGIYRRGRNESVLVLVVHHIVADLWSMEILLSELRALYAAERGGRRPQLPAPAASYADFVHWQALQVAGPEGSRAWDYWREALAGPLPILNLPTDRPRPREQTFRGDAHTWELAPELVGGLRDLAVREKTTPFIVLLSAFQVLLHRYTGQDDLILGTASAGRLRPEWEGIVGYCLNSLPLRSRTSAALTFKTHMRQTRLTFLQALEHQDYPFGLLVERLQPRREPGRPPVFQAMFIWDKPSATITGPTQPATATDGLEMEVVLMEQCGAPFELTFIIVETGGTLTASLRYNVDLFDRATMERMASHLNTLLRAACADPDLGIAELPLVTPAESRALAGPTGSRRADARLDTPFPHLFEEQAERTPEAVALVCEGRSLTYRDLNRRANQLARQLQNQGAGPGDLVGICLPRSVEMVVAVLAAWKAGAAYLPLDPSYPAQRLGAMLDDGRPAVILTDRDHAQRLPHTEAPLVIVDADATAFAGQAAENLPHTVELDDLAYVIFTSGSTGRPKGVLLRHRGLANLSEAQREVFELTGDDRALQFASLCFDASVFEIVMPLRVGAALVVATGAAILPGPELVALLRDQRVTTVTLPPSVLGMLPAAELPALRTIIVAGEACPAELVSAWAAGRRFFNAYGPTEATVWSTVARCVADGRAPTIGRAIAGTRCYVLDANLQPVPAGVPGELHLAGPGIALGYLNQPDLTVEKFVPNPFDSDDGGVLYKTGDLVRPRPDGELEFLGRIDQQIKLRGYRIEPGEIQAVLREHPAVRDALVIARRSGPCAAASLVAYVVPSVPGPFPLAEMQSRLRERLPHYMLPSALVPVAVWPLTPNGKIDRDALLALADSPALVERPASAPRTDEERQLVAIWSEVLKRDAVGIHDNFFDLGGASLQTLEVVTLATRAGLTLTPEMIFQYQTIAELAPKSVAELRPAPVPTPSNAPLVGSHDSRSEVAVAPAQGTADTPAPQLPATYRTRIESLGVYLPPKIVTTAEVVAGCATKLAFPLERMTGIRNRRMAGETEFSVDLAAKAIAECLGRSAHPASAIDLLICCNISRCDGPDNQFTFEPTTAAQLQRRCGLEHALAFDISNACAGTFTAITIADAFLAAGAVRRALIVSGEYISHLTRTAQKEIDTFVDPRIACLTLGDSGVALILERTSDEGVGFHDLDLYTLGKHSGLCVAKVTDRPHGGAIMVTDAVRSSALTINQAVGHALRTLDRRGWKTESVNHIIMHQTSETTIDGAVREINQALGRTACHRGNTVYNLAERGNTATNSHFVALMDQVQAGAIHPGDRVLFGVSGSGQTVGTALYTFDDLPDRIRDSGPRAAVAPVIAAGSQMHRLTRRVRVESVGTVPEESTPARDSVASLQVAAESCLGASRFERAEIGLLIHSGVYRNDFLSEPAMAAIAAGALAINHDGTAEPRRKTLAFDVMNGGVGTLDACLVAARMIEAGKTENALIVASEVENNARFRADDWLGVKETGSALILAPSDGLEGFHQFVFRTFPDALGDLHTYTTTREGAAALGIERSSGREARLLEAIVSTVSELLAVERITLSDVTRIFPPHVSSAFVGALAEALGLPLERFVTLPDGRRDYFTSSLAYTFQHAREHNLVLPGDLGLVIAAGAGIQVGCATYYF